MDSTTLDIIIRSITGGGIALFFWSSGYWGGRADTKLFLPKWVKVLYGKPNQSVYMHGVLLQTFGYIYGLYIIHIVMSLAGFPLLFPPRLVFIGLSISLGIIVIVDAFLDTW